MSGLRVVYKAPSCLGYCYLITLEGTVIDLQLNLHLQGTCATQVSAVRRVRTL